MNLTYFVVVPVKTIENEIMDGQPFTTIKKERKYVKVPAENIFQAFAQAIHLLHEKGFYGFGNPYTLPSFNGGYPSQVPKEKWIEVKPK